MALTPRRKALAWALVLAVSFVLYRSEHALEHFLWHLVYGGSFGLAIGAAHAWLREVPARPPSAWAGAGYVYMIVPDLIWIGPRLAGAPVHPHRAWMDVFLGHVFLDRWAWTTPLLAPALALGVTAWVLARRASPDPPTGAGPQR